MKKLLAVVLCLSLCLSPLPAYAEGVEQKTITVAAVANGEIRINGMSESGTTVDVDEGSDVDIDVAPGTGYEIESVMIGATTYSTDGEIGDRTALFSRTVTVNDDITVSAVFRPVQYTITTNVGPNGAVAPMNPKVDHGSDQTFTITPDSGYVIRSLTVDGNPASVDEHNQITLYTLVADMSMSVDFAEAVTYTITTVAGPHGSVTPANPTVAEGADVTFAITPDSGYIIDELIVDGLPETADAEGDGSYSFTAFNVRRSMTLAVSFMESVPHTITIPKPAHGIIQIVGEADPVSAEGTVITRNTKETVSYYIATEPRVGYDGRTYYQYFINKIVLQVEGGGEIDVTHDFYYDEAAGQIRIDIETLFDYTLKVEFKNAQWDFYLAILNSEATSDELIKAAAKREMALIGLGVPLEAINIDRSTSHSFISANGIPFDSLAIYVDDGPSFRFLTVEEYTDMVVYVYSHNLGSPEVTIIVDSGEPFSNDVQVEIPSDPLELCVFGPYAARIAGVFSNDNALRLKRMGTRFDVQNAYKVFQLHVANKGGYAGKQLNWFPMTLMTADALCLSVQATSVSGTQETFTWELDTYPDVTEGGATQEVFFGNDRVILEKPGDDIGDIASMSVSASGSPGYTFTNNPDGTITIDFKSDYYDKVTVPLTIVKQSGGTVQRNLTIHRVGVDIQLHNAAVGNPSPTRTVFHGTQNGNRVDFADGNRYKLTASYFIPDYGDERPYGLYVTRKYADGRIETQIVTQPLASPHPGWDDNFDPAKKIFLYNDGEHGYANAADYLIYAGQNAASAPVEVSVLVLKDAPVSGGTFGGVDYGSGTGVKWTKP